MDMLKFNVNGYQLESKSASNNYLDRYNYR